jgi:hypothetical protein
MKKYLSLTLLLVITLPSFGQTLLSLSDFEVVNRTNEVGIPYFSYVYSGPLQSNEHYHLQIHDGDNAFSVMGLGWEIAQSALNGSDFEVVYSSSNDGSLWTNQQRMDVEWSPEDTPTGLYWTEALFSYDAESYSYYNIQFSAPADAQSLRIDLFDGNVQNMFNDNSLEQNGQNNLIESKSGSRSCPSFPAIITRSQWCGGAASCSQVNAWYNPTYISPTHAVIHHGASPNTYSDGQAVVRSYYNYHVNTLGWADIGYHYLIDKHGNFYQGRHNPNMPNSDVRGAHAGTGPNNNSIGICFPGNLDIELATQVQLEKLYDLMAWWFDFNGISATGSSGMQTQAYGWQIQPHFTSHRAIGQTACPGNAIFNQMPNIRTNIQAVIDDCNTPADNIPPTTTVSTTYEWRGYDFWTNFDDQDNPGGTGVDRRFYQVLEFDGNEWRANPLNGFFNDNFNTVVHPSWTSYAGNWSISNGNLLQSDQNDGNTNIYAELNQTNDRAFQYHWQMRIEGNVSTNRRGGVHFFVDDPEGPNRGNSYLAWWRADDNAFHLYRIENNNLSLVQNIPLTIDLNTWYDCKVTYDPISGEIEVYTDNVLVTSWTDVNPLQSGQYISLRNGDSEIRYNNFKVRTERSNLENISVGPLNLKDSRFESPNPTQDACRINSMVIDNARNWSAANAKSIYIDWTNPTTFINVGSLQDEDFNVNFEDEDNQDGSGLTRRFYQVIDNDNGTWGANTERGFYFDSLNQAAFSPLWQTVSGNWQMTNGYMEQTDEGANNTNIYAPIAQNLSNRYLYHFDMKISGAGSNKRGGFHYFVDDPEALERGNSYFLWFRQDLSALEFYRVENNVFFQEAVFPFTFNANEWLNVKLVYDRITGEHLAYVNDNLIAEWIDPNPHTEGDYISFRSGHANLGIRNLAVFRTRLSNVTVTVGGPQSDIRFESLDNTSYAGIIRSIVHDGAHNLSDIDEKGIIVGFGTAGLTSDTDDISVFPNPFERNITVVGNNAEQMNYSLWSTNGQQIAITVQTAVGEVVISTPHGLAAGNYILRAVDAQGKLFQRKLIKQ